MSPRDPRRGLARGLDDLLGNLADTTPGRRAVPAEGEVELDRIEPNPLQPRRYFPPESLEGLAASIRAQGILQPILVRPKAGEEGRYQVIAGERRLRAAKMAGLERVPIIVRAVDDRNALTLTLLENLQREDLRPIELAQGLKELIERFGLTQAELGRGLGVSREQVSNTLRLLKLPEKVRELLDAGLITPGHGRLLASLEPPEVAQALGELVVERDLTVRELEMLIADQAAAEPSEPSEASYAPGETPTEPGSGEGGTRGLNPLSKTRRETKRDPDLVLFEEELQRRIGTQVKIRHLKTGRGRIIIEYYSPDELAGIIEKLTGRSPG
ncbi:MAG: ParB/RepB/Spo0J family partition protein [bacterium]|nr:ParB/RepB/Spo0J family partition protein [bacterium]